MKRIIITCLAAFLVFFPGFASAQIFNPKKILEKKANKVLEKKTDEAVDSIMGTGQKPQPKENSASVPANKEVTKDATKEVKQTNEAPTLQAYSKFDFVPGEKVIFFDDFAQEKIGDFP
jgi:OmpA-OmpF porin, OOP family